MRAFTTLLLVWVIIFASADSLAAESIFAIGGGVGFLELGGLKAFLNVTAQQIQHLTIAKIYAMLL